MTMTFRGYVRAAGGGEVTIVVDRDTAEYPAVGESVVVRVDASAPHTHRWQLTRFQDKCGCGAVEAHTHRWVAYSLTGAEQWDRCECGVFRTPEPEPVTEHKRVCPVCGLVWAEHALIACSFRP